MDHKLAPFFIAILVSLFALFMYNNPMQIKLGTILLLAVLNLVAFGASRSHLYYSTVQKISLYTLLIINVAAIAYLFYYWYMP
jgi:hypothetical protein